MEPMVCQLYVVLVVVFTNINSQDPMLNHEPGHESQLRLRAPDELHALIHAHYDQFRHEVSGAGYVMPIQCPQFSRSCPRQAFHWMSSRAIGGCLGVHQGLTWPNTLGRLSGRKSCRWLQMYVSCGPNEQHRTIQGFFVGLVVKITTGVWKFYGCPVAISQLLMVWLRSNQDFCRKVSRESGNKAKDRVYLRLLDADYAKLSNGVR